MLSGGSAKITDGERNVSRGPPGRGACGCDCILLLCVGFVSEVSQRSTGDEVALKIKIIVDRGMDAETTPTLKGQAQRARCIHAR